MEKNDMAGLESKMEEAKKPRPKDGRDGMAGFGVDWENIAKYKAAELENYIKRQKDAVANAYNDGRVSVIMAVLPVLDTVAEAIKNSHSLEGVDARSADGVVSMKKGLEILQRKFESNLMSLGLEEIACKSGDKFDPYVHNCVSKEHEDNIVREIWQKGYKFAGRVIRPVAVKI